MFIFLFSCSKKIEETKNYQILNFIQKISNGKIVEYEFDKKNWEILADSIIEINNYYIVLKFYLTFYNNNEFSGILIGDSGIMEKNSRNMKAYKSVIFKSKDSSFLKTNNYIGMTLQEKFIQMIVFIYMMLKIEESFGV